MLGLSGFGLGLPTTRAIFLHPALAASLLGSSFSSRRFSVDLDFEDVYCIFAAEGHWALLWGHRFHSGLHWTYLDGLSPSLRPAALHLAHCLSQLLGFSEMDFQAVVTQEQSHPHTCGTVAIWHLCMILTSCGPLDPSLELELHGLLLQFSSPTDHFMAFGRPLHKIGILASGQRSST